VAHEEEPPHMIGGVGTAKDNLAKALAAMVGYF
jgi:hypothetical protein